MLRDRVAAADRKIAEVQQKIDELNHAARRSGADLGVTLSRLQDDFTRVKGEIEVQQHRLAQIEQSLQAVDSKAEKRFAALKGRARSTSSRRRSGSTRSSAPTTRAPSWRSRRRRRRRATRASRASSTTSTSARWPATRGAPEAAFRSAEISTGQRRWREAHGLVRLDLRAGAQVRARARRAAGRGPRHARARRAQEGRARRAPRGRPRSTPGPPPPTRPGSSLVSLAPKKAPPPRRK